jgi:SAM-dependent methyltransferase
MKPDYYYDNARTDVIEMIPQTGFSVILEVGGGDFPTLRKMGDRYDAEIWGVDIREPEVAIGNFVLGSITDADVARQLPSEKFDLVIANDVIEHIQDTAEFLRIIHRVLKPGGILALSVPNIRQIRTGYQIFVRGTFPRDDAGLFDRTHLRWFCKRDVIAAATSSGFTTKAWQGSGRMVPKVLARTPVAEFLALQNLFIFTK